jgi:hypothetical protein
MMDYNKIRKGFTSNPTVIIELEHHVLNSILHGLSDYYFDIKTDFDKAIQLKDFWIRYAPRQRGHKPRGTSLPWGEVGEKVLDAYMYKTILSVFMKPRFIGLPYGHDLRFLIDGAFVHIDTKSTGPTDNTDEVVSSPNQVSGDGLLCDKCGVQNSMVKVIGPTSYMEFQPELPPFYIMDNQVYLTLTYYLKCVYKVISPGDQPLDYLELISVPNGLLMFDTYRYCKNKGLLTPGKDILSSSHKRTRIKLNPLSRIASWRCQKIFLDEKGTTTIKLRGAETSLFEST